MQTSLFSKLLIAGTAVIMCTSCAKTNTQGKLIPKEAAIVITLDGKALSSKLPWDEIKKNPLFTEMNSDSSSPAALKSMLDNPENSGMDMKADCMLFVVKDSMGGYIGFEGNIKDDKKFAAFNDQATQGGAKSQQNDVQFISKAPLCVGFTKDKFIYVFDAPQMSMMDDLSRRMRRDSISVSSVSGRDIGAACKALFALAESSSLAKDEKFTTLVKETGDVHFWMNTEELTKTAASSNAMAMLNMDKFYKGSITTATFDFDNGKISMKGKSYASDDLLSIFKKYSGGKVDEDMIKHMPGKDVVGMMALNFKPEALNDFIKLTGMDGLVNIGLKNFGFTLNDFVKANKGDILVGVSDLVMKPDTSTFKFKDQDENISISQKPNFNFVFAASIGDKDAFNKLINAGKKLGGNVTGENGKAPIVYNSNANWFVLSNKKETADQYLGTNTTSFDFINKINGEPFGGYLNIQSLLKAFESEATKDSSAKIAYDATLKMWDNITWKGGNYSDGGIEQTGEINLVDKSTNSLVQLNQYAAKLSELYKDKKKKMKEDAMAFQDFKSPADSVITPARTK